MPPRCKTVVALLAAQPVLGLIFESTQYRGVATCTYTTLK